MLWRHGTSRAIAAALDALAEGAGLNRTKGWQPVRAAVTGSNVSPPLPESLALLGRERTVARIRAAAHEGAPSRWCWPSCRWWRAAPAGPAAGVRRARRVTVAALKPPIVWKPIPFCAARKRQMAAYSNRHYGTWSWHLTDPKVIVEHYTDGTTWQGAWNNFAANVKHIGEFPGVCAHFIIDTDGTIYQLVSLKMRCRHAVGHELHLDRHRARRHERRRWCWATRRRCARRSAHAVADGEVRHQHRQRDRPRTRRLESPFHHELYPVWQCLVHADWLHRDMRIDERHVGARLRPRGPVAGVQGTPEGYAGAAHAIAASDVDVVCVQHEFGLYGIWRDEGWEGERWIEGTYEDHLAAFLEEVRKPTLVTFHTVLPEPTPAVRERCGSIAAAADGLVVMAESAVEILARPTG